MPNETKPTAPSRNTRQANYITAIGSVQKLAAFLLEVASTRLELMGQADTNLDNDIATAQLCIAFARELTNRYTPATTVNNPS